jgi:hypothetical protein
MNLTQVVSQLRDEHRNVTNYARELGASITILETLTGGARGTNIMRATPGTNSPKLAHTRHLSRAGRQAIATAQKARWAKQRGMNVVKAAKKAA